MKRRPTITDVAARAGVSKSTVSLVLQGSALVRAETAKTVREAMRDIGYVYNRAAATLRGTSVGLMGLSSTTCAIRSSRNSRCHFQMSMAARGYATVVSNADEDDGTSGKTRRLNDRTWRRRGGDQPGLW
jgi:LacI family transcriptional regulator